MPALMSELDGKLRTVEGGAVNRLDLCAFRWDDERERAAFLEGDLHEVTVPGSGRKVVYDAMKRVAIGVTRLGTSRAVALGAWVFALEELNAGNA
jgi:glucokinase